MQHLAADELYIEVPHAEHAAAGFAHDSERFGEHVVDRRPVGDAPAELVRLGAELLVGQRLDLRFERANLADERPEPLELTLVLGADDLRKELTEHLRRAFARYADPNGNSVLVMKPHNGPGTRPSTCPGRAPEKILS